MYFANSESSSPACPAIGRIRPGFSIVEMLVVIAVIGILAAAGISSLGNHKKSMEAIKNRRNAQEIAALCVEAGAAGVSFVAQDDPVQTARLAVAGATAANGSFAGKIFRLPGLREEDILGAAYYLDVRDTDVVYDSTKPNP